MWEFLSRVFGRETDRSKKLAKERLRLVLIHDRMDITPQIFDDLRRDLVKVISRYMEIDEAGTEMHLDSHNGLVALVASIPIIRVKNASKEARGAQGGSEA